MVRYGNGATIGRREVVEKKLGVAPVLARRRAVAGTGQRRFITGDPENARRVIGKRRYDPEDERRHRQGSWAATTGLGGVGALGYAGRQVRNDTQELRTRAGRVMAGPAPKLGPTPKGPGSLEDRKRAHLAAHQGDLKRHAAAQQSGASLRNMTHGRMAVVGARPAAYGAAGLGLLGVSNALRRKRREERWD